MADALSKSQGQYGIDTRHVGLLLELFRGIYRVEFLMTVEECAIRLLHSWYRSHLTCFSILECTPLGYSKPLQLSLDSAVEGKIISVPVAIGIELGRLR